MPPTSNDDRLLQSLIDGNEKGILEIYRILFPKVKSYILKNSGTEEDAKDVMQLALLQLSVRARAGNLTIQSSFEGYFFIVCRNIWRREQKKSIVEGVTKSLEQTLTYDSADIAVAAIEQEKWDLFQEKLQQLSENCRKILQLFFKKTPYAKIAEQEGYATELVVRQRVFKCKKKLKERIQADKRYNSIKQGL